MNIGRLFPAIVAIVFVAIGSVLIRAGFALHADPARLLSHGLSATGSVIEVHTEQRRTRDPYPEDIQGQGRGLRGTPGVYVCEVDVPCCDSPRAAGGSST